MTNILPPLLYRPHFVHVSFLCPKNIFVVSRRKFLHHHRISSHNKLFPFTGRQSEVDITERIETGENEKSWKEVTNQKRSGLVLDLVQKDMNLSYIFNC